MSAFGKTSAFLQDIERYYPHFVDVRERSARVELIDLLWWPPITQTEIGPEEPADRQLLWAGRQGDMGSIYPPWAEDTQPITLRYKRLCRLLRAGPDGEATPSRARLAIDGSHFGLDAGYQKVTEDMTLFQLGAEEGEAPPVFGNSIDMLRAVATFDAYINPLYRFDYDVLEPTPIIYTVTAAAGAWATATNLIIRYENGAELREVAVVRGCRE